MEKKAGSYEIVKEGNETVMELILVLLLRKIADAWQMLFLI